MGFVRSLLPVPSPGRRRLEDRRVLNGIVWKFRTGTAWRDVPERYGDRSGAGGNGQVGGGY
ncbi:transposase [Streptomyces sp. 900105755]